MLIFMNYMYIICVPIQPIILFTIILLMSSLYRNYCSKRLRNLSKNHRTRSGGSGIFTMQQQIGSVEIGINTDPAGSAGMEATDTET